MVVFGNLLTNGNVFWNQLIKINMMIIDEPSTQTPVDKKFLEGLKKRAERHSGPIITLRKQKPHTSLIPNELILDKDLSATAFKLWSLINSKSDDWKFSITELLPDFKENEIEVQKAKSELESRGYLRKDNSGNFELTYLSYEVE